ESKLFDAIPAMDCPLRVCDAAACALPARHLRRRSWFVSVALVGSLGAESRAQEIQRVDLVRCVGVGLLFDDVPAVADAERCRSHPQSPGKVKPATDLADLGVDHLEVLGGAEP